MRTEARAPAMKLRRKRRLAKNRNKKTHLKYEQRLRRVGTICGCYSTLLNGNSWSSARPYRTTFHHGLAKPALEKIGLCTTQMEQYETSSCPKVKGEMESYTDYENLLDLILLEIALPAGEVWHRNQRQTAAQRPDLFDRLTSPFLWWMGLRNGSGFVRLGSLRTTLKVGLSVFLAIMFLVIAWDSMRPTLSLSSGKWSQNNCVDWSMPCSVTVPVSVATSDTNRDLRCSWCGNRPEKANIVLYFSNMTAKRFLQLTNMPDLGGLSKDGRDWLTNSLDPFHDVPVALNGIPDGDFGDTVVQTIKKKVSITAPPSANGGRFDVHIFSLPILSGPEPQSYGGPYPPAAGVAVELAGNGLLEGSFGLAVNSQPFPLATVVAIAVPAGQRTFPRYDPSTPNSNGLPLAGTNIPVWYELNAIDGDTDPGGMSKLISGGFEVHNDTAELYLGGNVTTYCAPQSTTEYLTAYDPPNGGGHIPTNVAIMRGVPSNVSDATFYPNSRSWGAKEGCVVPFFLSNHEGFMASTIQAPCFRTNDTAFTGGTGQIDHPVIGAVIVTGSPLTTSNCRHAPMQTVGAYFTGLTNETVLTLDVRYTVERRPASTNRVLMSLASPTALLDRKALDLYDEIRRNLPVGAPVEWNESGKWWQTVLSKVGPAVKAVSPFLPPSLQMLGRGVSTASDLALRASQNKEVQAAAKQIGEAMAAKKAKRKLVTSGQNRK